VSENESTDFVIRFIIRFINYLQPIQHISTQPSNRTTTQQNQQDIRRRQNYRRRFNRYRLINLGNNHTRGCITLRARHITQQNRLIATHAEQDLVNAILQAREEQQFLCTAGFIAILHHVDHVSRI